MRMSTGFSPAATTSTTSWPSSALGSSNSPISGGAPYQCRIAARMTVGYTRPPDPTARRSSFRRMDTRQLAEADRRLLWHPFTQQQGWTDHEEVLLIERADR